MKHLPSRIDKNLGVTLTEVMIVVAIIGIIAAFAVPSYQDLIERNRLKQAAESLANDLKFARTEAIKRSEDTTLALSIGWSYLITSFNSINGVTTSLKTVQGSDFQGIALDAAAAVTFSFRRGLPAATLRSILSSSNYQTAIDVCNSGKIIACTPTGQTGLPGYPICPVTEGDC